MAIFEYLAGWYNPHRRHSALGYQSPVRDDRRRLNDYRLAILRSVVHSYNQIKAVRRTLRAAGFRSPRAGVLRDDQVTEFNTQMKILNDAQLSIETIAREIVIYRDAFDTTGQMAAKLSTVERYIHNVVKDWESNGASVCVAADITAVNAMKNFQKFLGDAEQGFELEAATPMEFVEQQIQMELLPSSDVAPSLPTLKRAV